MYCETCGSWNTTPAGENKKYEIWYCCDCGDVMYIPKPETDDKEEDKKEIEKENTEE